MRWGILVGRIGRLVQYVSFLWFLVKGDSKISRVSVVEEDWLELCFDGSVVPVFSENVCWVLSTAYVREAGDACCNGFTCAMVGKSVVSLVEF